jgi:hypothetical protein
MADCGIGLEADLILAWNVGYCLHLLVPETNTRVVRISPRADAVCQPGNPVLLVRLFTCIAATSPATSMLFFRKCDYYAKKGRSLVDKFAQFATNRSGKTGISIDSHSGAGQTSQTTRLMGSPPYITRYCLS